ncbi:unnamed protein product [Phaedon cochleariae]|uniref:Uncharacterized protein n=1 Tax=Phaedon cochleariae TaxID=80249 RepID=A0A9N9SFN8_PHACE|nr:unnamed protein product [Phaedon cochleariae]
MTLATCAKDIKFYKWPDICYVGTYESPADCMTIRSISWSCDGKELLAVKSKGNPVILSAPTRPEQYVEAYDCSYANRATVATFSTADPDVVAFGTEEGGVYIYNVKSPRHPVDHLKLPSAVQNLEYTLDDQCLAAGCSNGQIILLDAHYKPCASFVVPNSPTLCTIACSKTSSNLLAGASKEGVLCLWDTETTDSLLCSKRHSGRITDLDFGDTTLSSVGADGKFLSYDLRSYKCVCNYELDCSLSSLAYLRGTHELAVSTASGQLRSYDSRNMKSPLRTFVASANGGIKKIAFPNAGDYLSSSVPVLKFSRNYEDEFSASGDFSIKSDSSPRRSNQTEQRNFVVASEESCEAETEVVEEGTSVKVSEMEEFSRVLEERIKTVTKEFEDKLLQTFYALRINTSKQFIGLEEKISHSWNNFVDYLRLSGAGTVCNSGGKTSREEFEEIEQGSSYQRTLEE